MPSGGAFWSCSMAAIMANLKRIFGFEILGLYRGTDVLILMGEKSAIYDIKTYQPIFPNIKNENVKIIAEAGHWVHADKPKETIEELVKFFKSIDHI